jgi:hypothetical protein
MAEMKIENWIAIYAALVGTIALSLELRRWFESAPRLSVNITPNGMVIGGGPEFDERNLVIVNVVNCGTIPILITSLDLYEMPSWWRRRLKRPTRFFAIPNPQLRGYPSNLPGELDTAQRWTGAIRERPDVIPDLHNGAFYVAVRISHHKRPYLRRIPKQAGPAKPEQTR